MNLIFFVLISSSKVIVIFRFPLKERDKSLFSLFAFTNAKLPSSKKHIVLSSEATSVCLETLCSTTSKSSSPMISLKISKFSDSGFELIASLIELADKCLL